MNTVHISSVALSPWISNVLGLDIDETSIGPEIVFQTSVEVTICVMYDVVVFVMCAMY